MNQRALHAALASPQSLWLTFHDRDLEQRYLAREYPWDRRFLTIVSATVIGLLVTHHIADPWLLPDRLIGAFRQVRSFVLMPLPVVLLIFRTFLRHGKVWFACVGSVVASLAVAWLLFIGGELVVAYVSVGSITIIEVMLFLVGMPVRISVPIAGLMCGIFIATALYWIGSTAATVVACGGHLTIVLVGVVGAYRAEKAERSLFIERLRSEADYAARLAAEEDRNRWLSVMAHFFGHELRNAVISTRTSLELAQRCNTDPQLDRYLARGHRSADFMNELLRAAANATTLESALATQALEPLELSQLILARIEDFRAAHPERQIDAQVRGDLWIQGHAERWLQLMDKLLDNALEHGRSDQPIRVECQRAGNDIVLSVEDRGDELPADCDGIFGQFVSGKRGEQNTGNLGLGLFIARVIATRHHGTIVATPLHGPPGAKFIVKVPCLERP